MVDGERGIVPLVYGGVLFFHVDLSPQFMNCTSQDSFQQPRVHCVGDDAGFQYLYPSHELAVQYAGRHLPHVR